MTQLTSPETLVSVPTARPSRIADPTPFATGLLAFQLILYFARWVHVTPATLAESPMTTAVNYSLLIAAIGQLAGGILSIIRGSAYVGYVASTFGAWLLGFFLLVTAKDAEPDAIAFYMFALIVPLVILMVPAVVRRRVAFVLAFGAIVVLLFLDGFAFHHLQNVIEHATATKTVPDVSTSVDLLRASAWCALVAVVSVLWITARAVYEATGLLKPTEHL